MFLVPAVLLTLTVLSVASILLSVEVRYRAKEKNISAKPSAVSEDMYYYNLLTAKEQILFDSITDAIEAYEASSEIVPYRYSKEELERISKAILLDCTNLFYIDADNIEYYCDNYKTNANLKYLNTPTNIKKMKMEIEAVSAAAQAYTNEATSDFEKAVALHDFLTKHCTKLTSEKVGGSTHTSYGALVEKSAYSDGYASAYKELMNRCSVECITVEGEANGSPHIWNIAKLDGKYYHIDVCWDDTDIDFISELNFHGFFMLSDKEISKTHTMDKFFSVPECNFENNFYIQTNSFIKKAENVTDTVYPLIKKAVENNLQFIEICPIFTKNEDDYREQLLAAIDKINSEYEAPKISRSFRSFSATPVGFGVTIQIYYI